MRVSGAYAKVDVGALQPANERNSASREVVPPQTVAIDAPPATKVTLSARAQELAARSDRMEALKKSIKSGAYAVDAASVASKLVGTEE